MCQIISWIQILKIKAALEYTIVDLKPPNLHITHLVYVLDSIDVRLENVVYSGKIKQISVCNVYVLSTKYT